MKYIFITILFLSFIGGEITRFTFTPGVPIKLVDLIVACIGGFTILKIIFKKGGYTVFLNPIGKAVLIFIFIGILSLISNIYNFTTIELAISSLYLIRWIIYALVLFYFMGNSESVRHFLYSCMLATGAIILFLGYIQYFFYANLRNLYYLGWDEHLYRLFSVFLDPNFAGAFFVLYFLFLFYAQLKSLHNRKKNQVILLRILMVLTFLSIILTYSRSALIMLIAGSGIMLILTDRKKYFFYLIGIILIALTIISPFFYLENINPFRKASSEARIETAKNALVIFKEHPIIGIGFNTYRLMQIKYGFRQKPEAVKSHADNSTDNSFLFILATTGIVGLCGYLFLIFTLFKKAYSQRTIDPLLTALAISSLGGLTINSFFINSLFYPFFMLWIWIIFSFMDYN